MITIERATTDTLPEMLDILHERHVWLRTKGTDQWPSPFPAERLAEPLANQTAYMARDDAGLAVGCFVLESEGCTDYWTPDELTEPSLYLCKFAVRRASAGLGAPLLNWCRHQAALGGYQYVRLNAWRTNTALHSYYLDKGFRHVRTVELPGRTLGALFEIKSDLIPTWERPADDLDLA